MNIRRIFVGTVVTTLAYYIMSVEGDTRTGNRCIEDLSKVFTIQLQCSVGEWIHVVHEVYGSGDATTCRLKSAESCGRLSASSRQGLVVNCNGKQSCREAMAVQPIDNCNITDAAAEVKYNCVKGSMNMCSPVATTVTGSVYLHSPGFPDSAGVNCSCVLRITGQNIQVTLLQKRMRSGMLNISGDGRQFWTNVNMYQYNRVLPGLAAEIVIIYDNHDQDGSNVWIHVVGSGQMNITINREIVDASTTPTSTQQLSRSHSTSSSKTLDTATTETTPRALSTAIAPLTTVTSTDARTNAATQWSSKSTTIVSTTASTTDTNNSELEDVVIALSVVCGFLVVIIVVLVIYFMVVKPFRKKKNSSSNTVASDGHGESNVYDGIQRGTSEAGDEHNYGQITSSGGPVYVYSVSGSDPYVNT